VKVSASAETADAHAHNALREAATDAQDALLVTVNPTFDNLLGSMAGTPAPPGV
jgi:hypothetical protein